MASVDDLKAERDGHLFWGKAQPCREEKPPVWLIERDEDGLPCRMYWTGYDWNGVHYTEKSLAQQEGAQK